MLHRVLDNYLLVHISDVTSCTVRLDTGTYFRCFIVYSTTRYCHILVALPLENKDIIDGYRQNMPFKEPQRQCNIRNMSVSSCTVHDEASEICASI
jgi:hypothetical protein